MKILFLDDSESRRRAAYARFAGDDLTIVATAQDAINALKDDAPFDYVSLDHDLVGSQPMDSNSPLSGMEVVRWIVANKPAVMRFNVHSWNIVGGADLMVDALKVWYNVERRLFGDKGFVDEEIGSENSTGT